MPFDVKNSRQAIVNSFSNPNPESVGVFKMIADIYPAFAKKIFEKNDFMKMIVMTNLSPMHILEYPICGKCETLSVYSGFAKKDGKYVSTCNCFAEGCGHTTINPVTFKTWLLEEMRKKAPKDFADTCEYLVDRLALSLMKKYLQDVKDLQARERGTQQHKMGLTDIYGEALEQEKCEVTLTETNSRINLEEEMKRIAKEEGNLNVHKID